ncbi:hypothetical protein C8R45DRAFT_779595, partial [Mycena sanguinolenta]
FIVASRPDPHIHEVFDSRLYFGKHRSINVEKSFEDVRRYSCDEFSRIHRDHSTMASIPSPWPVPHVLQNLVQKSSGYFVYASTIIKFIDDKNHRPTERLAAVRLFQDGNRMVSESPFEALDQLYMAILCSAPRQSQLIPILSAISLVGLDARSIDLLFGLQDGEPRLILRGLHSVLVVPAGDIEIIYSHHISFLEFLNHPSRSQQF